MSKQFPGGIISKTPVTPSGPYENSTASGIWTLDQQAYWQKLGQWPIPGNIQPDAQFNYVTMLLHGDGTNGAQNNTFLDSSTNNFTITRNGNTTQGSFSPYGANWSNYFDGTGDYLSIPDNAALEGFTDFTFECWLYVSDFESGDIVFAKGFGPGFAPYMFYFTTTDLVFYASSTLSGWDIASSQTIVSNIVKNQWYHVAASRSGSSIKLFANGAVTTSITNSLTVGTNASTFNVAGAVDGTRNPQIYISNLRINNTALYTAAFTPSTIPLTAVSGTVLLTCADNRFIDDSTNAFTVSPFGNSSVQRFNPFGTTTAYSTATIGGSGYFDGTGDYLSIPSSTAFDMGSGDFTIDGWFYSTNTSGGSPRVITNRARTGGNCWSMQTDGSKLEVYAQTVTVYSAVGAVRTNTWYHFALERNGANFEFYLNGVRVSQVGAVTLSSSSSVVYVGADATYTLWNGYITDFRIVKGTAVYSGATYTVPTAPATAITNTQLLLSTTNGAIFDNAMMNDLETVGNAQISTSVVKYGTGSIDGFNSASYLQSNSGTTVSNFGSGDFTVEFWLNTNTSTNNPGVVVQASNTGAANTSWGIFLGYTSSTSVDVYLSDGSSYFANTGGGNVTDSTWHHIAFARSGSSGKLFVDGVQVGSTLSLGTTALGNGTLPIRVGGQASSYIMSQGYIDDLRITKGYARYTANFTPPSSAFPNFGPT